MALLAPAATAAGAVLAVDPASSRMHIHLDRAGLAGFLGHAHEIEAPLNDGRVEIVADDPSRSSVRLEFETAPSPSCPGPSRRATCRASRLRMRGPEVLDAEAHPAIAFESAAVTVRDAGARHEAATAAAALHLLVRGTLRLRGQPVEVEIPVEVRREAQGFVASGETSLELRALGIEPPAVAGVVKVANRFRLSFELHCTAAAPPAPPRP